MTYVGFLRRVKIVMDISNKAIVSNFNGANMDESLTIYEGNLCIYSSIIIKFRGRVYYDMTDTSSIKFDGDIYKFEEIKDEVPGLVIDRKSTRLNSSHANISYAVFCLKKKKNRKVRYI